MYDADVDNVDSDLGAMAAALRDTTHGMPAVRRMSPEDDDVMVPTEIS